MSVIPITVG